VVGAGERGVDCRKATCGIIRLKLLEIGASCA
jgi:hypothetical protein